MLSGRKSPLGKLNSQPDRPDAHDDIDDRAERAPPLRHRRIADERVVDEIEAAVQHESGSNQSKRPSAGWQSGTRYCHSDEARGDGDFKSHYPDIARHDSKEHVHQSDDDQNRTVEWNRPALPRQVAEPDNAKTEEDSGENRHGLGLDQ